MSVAERQRCIEPGHPQLSVTRQCELIGLPRSSYYRPRVETESEENLMLMRLIDEEHQVQSSMDGKGRATDNIMIERLWRSVKYEETYLKEYRSVSELVQALKRYFEFYNNERPHQSLHGQTPAEVYWGTNKMALAA